MNTAIMVPFLIKRTVIIVAIL